MTYRSIGLSTEQVVKDVFKQANIEAMVHSLPHGNVEAILYTSEHDEAIRAEERRKFKEWFKKSNHYLCYSDTIEKVMEDYEKESRNE